MITRFSVPNLSECSILLTKVASEKLEPELILSNARVLSTYTDRIIEDKEVWIAKGRIACVKENGQAGKIFNKNDLVHPYKLNAVKIKIRKCNSRINAFD